MGSLAGKIALIAGASAGIGRATALRMAEEGALVVAAARRLEVLDELVQEIRAAGGTAEARQLDVTDLGAYVKLIEDVAAAHGRLDIHVHNAMGGAVGGLASTTLDIWRENMLANADACFVATQAASRIMAAQGGGSIVNIASIGALRVPRGHMSYGASKAALVHLSASAAVEAGPSNVRVNVVAPGLIDTATMRAGFGHSDSLLEDAKSKIPLRRFGTPIELANAVVFLASDEASFISGVTLLVDGGRFPTM